MIEVRYDTQASTLQRFMASRRKVQAVMGPMGSGKTSAFIFKVLRLICDQEPQADKVRRSRWLITRNTYGDLKSTTIRDWRDIVKDELGQFSMSQPPEHKLRFRLDDGTRVESDVMFVALDRPDHIRKLRGVQITGAWMNEAKEQPKAILDTMTMRVGRYPRLQDGGCTWRGVLMDYNAPDEDHWLFTLEHQARLGELPDFEFFIQPGGVVKIGGKWTANPEAENLNNLEPGYYESNLQGKAEDYIKVNLGNQYGFVQDGKPVHPEYQDHIHCAQAVFAPTKGIRVIVGMDFGLTPAAAFTQRMPTGQWQQFDELVATDMGAERFAEQLSARCAEYPGFDFRFVGDPSGDIRAQTDEDTVFKVLRAGKINAFPVRSNDVVLRRGALDRPLTRMIGGKPGFLLSPKCKVTRKGLQGAFCYRRVKVAGDDRYHDEPVKSQYSHIVEGLEYALLDGGENISAPVVAPTGPSVIRVQTDWSPFGAG